MKEKADRDQVETGGGAELGRGSRRSDVEAEEGQERGNVDRKQEQRQVQIRVVELKDDDRKSCDRLLAGAASGDLLASDLLVRFKQR